MRQTEDASMLTYLHQYYHHADSIWSESWSPAPLAALLDFGHSSDLCDQAGHSIIKYIYHYCHSVGTGSFIYLDSTLISLSRWTILNSSSWGAAIFLITLCKLFKLSEGDFSTAVEGLIVALVWILLKAWPGTLFSPYSDQVIAASFPSLRDIPLCFLTVIFNFPSNQTNSIPAVSSEQLLVKVHDCGLFSEASSTFPGEHKHRS